MASTTNSTDDPTTDFAADRLTAAQAIASTLRATLGPNGLDKMLIDRSGTVIVTNTGATVLDGVEIDAPAGRVVRDAIQAHARRVGDGTTTTALLIGELLAEADRLVDRGLHPSSIVEGYARAADRATETLRGLAAPADDDETLRAAASTAVTGRWRPEEAERFAALSLDALRSVDFDAARLTLHAYPGGGLTDAEQVEGILVDIDASSTTVDGLEADTLGSFAEPTVALVDDEVTLPDAGTSGTVTIRDADGLATVREHERETRRELCRDLVDRGVDVLVCQKSVDEGIRAALAGAGVLSVERTRQDEFDALARAAGATAVAAIDDLDNDALGTVGGVRRRHIGEAETLTFSGLPAETHVSLVLRGGTPHVAEETKRIADDCLSVLRHAERGGVVPGGGAAFTAVSRAVAEYADGVDDRSALAVRAFADAVTVIPRVLAANAGADPVDAMTELRARHHDGETSAGVGRSGAICDVSELNVFEPVAVPARCLTAAVETSSLVVRIDDTLAAASDDGDDTHDHGDHDGHDHDGHADDHAGGYPWALSH